MSTGWLSVLRSKLISKQIMYIINFSELLRTLAVGLQTSYGTTELSQVGWEEIGGLCWSSIFVVCGDGCRYLCELELDLYHVANGSCCVPY